MVLAVLSLLVAGLVLVRGPIARAMPATAPLFEALGMKARTTDLAIEGVHSQAAFQGETPVLTVTGAVRNAASAAQPAPPIRVRLKDRAGKIVAQRTATPADAAVPAHATRYFAVIVPNPPSTSAGLEVDFTAEPAPAKEPKPNRRTTDMADPTVLLTEAEIAGRVEALAQAMAPRLDDETVAVCLLTGGLWFCADLTRALARNGRRVRFDALWLASYRDERVSTGRCEVRADLQRPLVGRKALVVDDVFDTGLSLSEAARLVRDAGAAEVLTCVFARKPWPTPRAIEPDFVAWEAPPASWSATAWTPPAPCAACPMSGRWTRSRGSGRAAEIPLPALQQLISGEPLRRRCSPAATGSAGDPVRRKSVGRLAGARRLRP
jgi:hypoxanthine phosphoribosyltransferase